VLLAALPAKRPPKPPDLYASAEKRRSLVWASYRKILNIAAVYYDPVAREFIVDRARTMIRRYKDETDVKKIREHFASLRKMVHLVGRANSGNKDDQKRILRQAYGLAGKLKYRLSDEAKLSLIEDARSRLPQISRRLARTYKPIIPNWHFAREPARRVRAEMNREWQLRRRKYIRGSERTDEKNVQQQGQREEQEEEEQVIGSSVGT